MSTTKDRLERRCPILGHPVHFSYCRRADLDTPCRKILDCWFETFDVEAFMRDNYHESVMQKILAPPKPKMLSILEIAQQAMQSGEREKD